MKRSFPVRAAAVAGVCALLLPGRAQQIDFGGGKPEASATHVAALTDAVTVQAGAPQEVELRFRVEGGFHINSHTPKDELLVPTGLKLEPAEGLKVFGEQYPAGVAFRLADTDLDVYQGEFRVRVRLEARRGETLLTGGLRYQACDRAVCLPARTLPVRVAVTAK